MVLFGVLGTLGVGILHAGDRPAGPSANAAGVDLGDVNCDGALNGADIDPFFLALVLPDTYATSFPDCPPKFADINQDQHLDGADIDLFFACLDAGQCPP